MHHLLTLSIDSAFWHPGYQMHQMSRMQVKFFADVISFIFEPLEDVTKRGEEMNCSDGKVRQCFPVLAAWIADHISKNYTLSRVQQLHLRLPLNPRQLKYA